jgi:hypothetical protein
VHWVPVRAWPSVAPSLLLHLLLPLVHAGESRIFRIANGPVIKQRSNK